MTLLTTRPYRPSDAPALADMFNVIDLAIGRPAAMTAALVDEFVAGTVVDPATDSQVVLDDDDLIAAGFVTTPPPGGHRLDLIGGVVPGARGRGVGATLLGWQLARAEELHAAIAPGSAWEAHAEAAQLDPSGLALLARFGLEPVRYSFDMVASTANVPDTRTPDGLTITGYDRGQARRVYEAHVEAFADHWGFQVRPFDRWSAMTLGSAVFAVPLSVVALADGEIAGYTLAYNDATPDRVYIGQVGVRRPWRRRGLAGAMLARVLRLAADAGRTTAALDVDADSLTGAVGVYERVGFSVERTMVTCSRALA